MSEDTFSNCVAIKLQEGTKVNIICERLYDYLDASNNTKDYSVQSGNDFIAFYSKNEDHYGITRVGDPNYEFINIWRSLMDICYELKIPVNTYVPKYYTDFWYNGSDCNSEGMDWKDL